MERGVHGYTMEGEELGSKPKWSPGLSRWRVDGELMADLLAELLAE